MSSPDPDRQNQSSGILERSATSGNTVTVAACIGTGADCVAKTDTITKPKRPRRFTNRRYDPLKRRTLAEWRAAFEALGRVTIPVICCARKVYFDYPATAPITQCFKESYLSIAYLPDDEEVAPLLLRMGYTALQAQRAQALTGKRGVAKESDREVNRERRLGILALRRSICKSDDYDEDFGVRWGSHDPDAPPARKNDHKPMPPRTDSNSASMSEDTLPIAGLGMTVKAFLSSRMGVDPDLAP
jgi:hypothetical protein